MSLSSTGSRSRGRLRPLDEAREPRSYDRRFYAGVLLAAFLLIVVVVGFAVYRTAFYTEVKPPPGPSFDLRSLATGGGRMPDPSNPCIVLQEHLETTRRGSYKVAYDFFCNGLKEITSFDDFVANARSSGLLFHDVSGYSCHEYVVNGTAANATGYINYEAGGRSRIEAAFAREGESWRISVMTVIYQ